MEPGDNHFSSHLHELRQRVFICVLTIALMSGISYMFRVPIADFLVAPLFKAYPDLATFIYTNLTEALFSYIKLAILVGIIASFPILCYQVWMYIAPGLHKNEQKTVFFIVFFSTSLFAAGAAFAYFVVLPKMLSFFMSFAAENIQPKPKFGLYLTFVSRTSLAFGLAFEIPFLMAASAKIGWVKNKYFSKKRPYFYIAILVLAFLLTAGDVLGAILLAFPLFALYEAGILTTRLFPGTR
jgi:sec-independent protein translocase protein TatC